MIASMPGHRTQFLVRTLVMTDSTTTAAAVTEVPHDVDDTKDEAARAEEGEVGAALVAHVLVRGLPAGDVVENSLRRAEWVLRVV